MRITLALTALALAGAPAAAADKPASSAGTSGGTSADIARILDEGLNRSQAMKTAEELTDGIGGRLTNSPSLRKAESWAMDKFTGWGLKNVRKDPWNFGRGWSFDNATMTMLSPRLIHLRVIPVAWTPPTNGTLKGEIIVAPMKAEKDFAAWKGKLKGKIVLYSLPGNGSEPKEAPFQRYSGEDIAKMDQYELTHYDPEALERRLKSWMFTEKLDQFLKSEGALAWGKISYRDGSLLQGEGYSFEPGKSPALPGFEIAAEDYRRLARLAKVGPAPVVEMTSDAKYDDSDMNAHNIIAEIPGSDPKAGYVMAGGHFDSWIAGDGAADNGAGSVMVMEAARILQSLGVKPKRTIRFILWEGEEQGLLGSMAYVKKYLASRPEPEGGLNGIPAYFKWPHLFPVTKQPGYDDLKAYFNIDNGSGKLRGIYAENNVAAVPLLREWLSPFDSLGAGKVVMETTDGTDHVFMQSVGVPGFQFIQDPLDYESRVHHSNLDTFDHLKGDDMRQGATVLAGMLLQAANSDKTLPHEAIPTGDEATDPFKYKDPADD